MIWFTIGLIIGLFIGYRWPEKKPALSNSKRPTNFNSERKQFLIERMCRIFELCELNIDEIDTILCRNLNLWNDRISWATNHIADLLAMEDLNILEGNELFRDCYQKIHMKGFGVDGKQQGNHRKSEKGGIQ